MFKDPLIQSILDHKNLAGALDGLEEEAQYEINKSFIDLRFDHDFEYWAITTVKIQDKDTKTMIPFRLRAGQRKLLGEFEAQRRQGIPIRIILLKARQWGGSTLTQIYMAWLQIRHYERWHSGIVSEVETQAGNIRAMYDNLIKFYPPEFGKLSHSPFQGQMKNRVIHPSGAVLSIGSMQKPDTLRSGDYAMLHLSEVGLWKKTDQKRPEDLIQALRGALSDVPGSLEVIESTAKGTGNYYHSEWLRAVRGETNSVPVFVAFFEIEKYQSSFESDEEEREFILSMNDNEISLFGKGATLESIKWYRKKLRDFGGEIWRMNAEYPPSPTDAFQSTGRRFFPARYVQNARSTIKKPLVVGELYGRDHLGPETLKDLLFEETLGGRLKIWKFPGHGTSQYVKRRYCGFADIGGASAKADKSDICVLDRFPMLQGGPPEVVATWNGNLDQDIFAWVCAQLGVYYHNMLLAIETNSLKTKETDTEGEHGITIIDELKDHYPNLYCRTTPEQINEGVPKRYGFHTNHATKTMILTALKGAMREGAYVEHDENFCNEADTYEITNKGKFAAVEGNKDDRVMTRAGAVWLATKHMDPPEIVVPVEKRKQIVQNSPALL